ncbi:protein of unknown function (plasmid) [Cupriavidus neocaledonicus]|uniref:Uncharacterized protein n=1 Tax=Cupriavidus neocaledonicus TaxID=1040979 RepID=A0A375HMC2_9BURK|nr:hypothetical protein CBM2605_B150074 [Cupriavidus neocaledonicus]SPD59032.1 protein of unknown function [Cupriavidus neocaledonicus]
MARRYRRPEALANLLIDRQRLLAVDLDGQPGVAYRHDSLTGDWAQQQLGLVRLSILGPYSWGMIVAHWASCDATVTDTVGDAAAPG